MFLNIGLYVLDKKGTPFRFMKSTNFDLGLSFCWERTKFICTILLFPWCLVTMSGIFEWLLIFSWEWLTSRYISSSLPVYLPFFTCYLSFYNGATSAIVLILLCSFLPPENLLLTADHKTVKLADFGLAREESLTEMMTAETGTYRWMAPEVIKLIIVLVLFFPFLSPLQVLLSIEPRLG